MNFRSFQLLGALVIVVFIGGAAIAEIVTFQKGVDDPFTGELYAGFEDSLLINVESNANYADYNFGLYPYIGIGVNGTDNAIKRKELMRFDITSLADEYTSINSVTLRLYPYSVGTTTGSVNFANNLQLFRLSAANGDWVEGTQIDSEYPVEVGSPCWNYRAYNDTPWASGTPGTDATDYTGGPIAVTPFDSVPTDWVELEFTDLSFINDWVAGNNSGMILRVENEVSESFLLFLASNDWEEYAEYWPQLVIDYNPVPEPTSVALLIGGLLAIVCLRRITA